MENPSLNANFSVSIHSQDNEGSHADATSPTRFHNNNSYHMGADWDILIPMHPQVTVVKAWTTMAVTLHVLNEHKTGTRLIVNNQ